MKRFVITRREFLKAAGAAGGLAAAGVMLGPMPIFAGDGADSGSLGRFGPWSPPLPIDELASVFDDFHPAISRDERSLYFSTTRDAASVPAFPVEILVAQRAGRRDPWEAATRVPGINLAGTNSSAPNLTPNGHLMYFQSKRAQGPGFTDLYVSYRQHTNDDFDWQEPIPLPGALNTATASETAATYFRDPNTGVVQMYFARYPGAGTMGNPGEDWDIWISVQDAEDKFGPGQPVSTLNSDTGAPWSRDTRTAIRRDGLEMFITSNRHGGRSYSGGPIENLWVATRDVSTDDWRVPKLVAAVDPSSGSVEPFNGGFGDGGPALSWDGTTLYFFSQRIRNPPGGAQTKPSKRQLWTSTRENLGA